MSNLGNKLLAGYYPTPHIQGEHLRQLLDVKDEGAWLDPTCGEGAILSQLADGHDGVSTYGVELDKNRASEAQKALNVAVQSPIESMVISNESFQLLFLNPPYDFSIKSYDDKEASRKELDELQRNCRKLEKGGLLIYIIPSYRFSNPKIARYLSSYFEDVGVMRFTDEADCYERFKQCIFIGRKKGNVVESNEKLFSFLSNMDSEDFVKKNVSTISQLVGRKYWEVHSGNPSVKTFYSRLEKKEDYFKGILKSKGFAAFRERSKVKRLEIGGNPILPQNEGQLALLLAAGAITGELGEGESYHLVQGLENVSTKREEETKVHESGSKTKKTVERTIRSVSVKVITPQGIIKKYV
ncbi:DUF6094 domain-containing protein [Pontibacillus halophilus]|uniref:DUF6094 domain-containing protein n=1 Tax=Pontibacillus halophilus TaxID=516704 RepID=UPI00041EDAEA|nr:DUF6094 domain-containing protein [Pontibacillus halophilus]